MTTIKNLHFKWTISRGRDTYGYNICTLLVDGVVKGKCNGGGYDMQGTSFAQWLSSEYQSQLVQWALQTGVKDHFSRTYETKDDTVKVFTLKNFYGVFFEEDKEGQRVVLDGATGFDCMKRVAEAIGIKLQWNKESNRYKNHTFYTAIIEEPAKTAI